MSLPPNAITIFEGYVQKYSKMMIQNPRSMEAHCGLENMLNNLLDHYGVNYTEEIIKKYNLEMFGFGIRHNA